MPTSGLQRVQYGCMHQLLVSYQINQTEMLVVLGRFCCGTSFIVGQPFQGYPAVPLEVTPRIKKHRTLGGVCQIWNPVQSDSTAKLIGCLPLGTWQTRSIPEQFRDVLQVA